jgi:hypothetical protein
MRTGSAVILGGSIAGLLAARVLADFFDAVLVVKGDVAPPPSLGLATNRNGSGTRHDPGSNVGHKNSCWDGWECAVSARCSQRLASYHVRTGHHRSNGLMAFRTSRRRH